MTMDRIPENATFHFGIVLQDTIRSKDGGLKKCKSIIETSRMFHELETAAIEYKKAVGDRPPPERLKELLWQVIDPDTQVEAKRKGLDNPSANYERLCIEIKDRLMTMAPQYAHVFQGRDKPDVVTGVSNLEQQPPPSQEAPEPGHPTEPEAWGEDNGLDAFGKGKGKGKGDSGTCNR